MGESKNWHTSKEALLKAKEGDQWLAKASDSLQAEFRHVTTQVVHERDYTEWTFPDGKKVKLVLKITEPSVS